MNNRKHISRLELLRESAERSAKRLEEEKEEVIDNYLTHHGILGMKWGVRRYQDYPKGHNQLKEGGRFTGNKPKKMSKKERLESSRKEGVDYANKLAADHKKGTSVANALISAQKKAWETGIVDSNFLNNPNISQKAKNKVTNLAKLRVSEELNTLQKSISINDFANAHDSKSEKAILKKYQKQIDSFLNSKGADSLTSLDVTKRGKKDVEKIMRKIKHITYFTEGHHRKIEVKGNKILITDGKDKWTTT